VKEFHLGDILSVTTGRVVSPRGMRGMCDILGYMTGETTVSRQFEFARTVGECAGPLLKQHPALADVRLPDGLDSETAEAWLASQVVRFGERLPVSPLGERYRLLADHIISEFNPPDGVVAEIAIVMNAVSFAAAYIREQPCTCVDDIDAEACDRCQVLGQDHGKPVES
jgi:hypothetical protein